MLRKSQFYLTFCLTMYRGKVPPVTNYAPYHDDVWGSGGTASVVLSLGAIWTLSVHCYSLDTLPRERALDTWCRSPGGPHSRFGRYDEQKNLSFVLMIHGMCKRRQLRGTCMNYCLQYFCCPATEPLIPRFYGTWMFVTYSENPMFWTTQ